MLSDFLAMSWNDVRDSDYDFKSNTLKHVIEISGSQVIDGDDSTILVYYNVYTNYPMICLQHYVRIGIEPEVIPGFAMNKSEGVNEDGIDVTDIVYVSAEIKSALEA